MTEGTHELHLPLRGVSRPAAETRFEGLAKRYSGLVAAIVAQVSRGRLRGGCDDVEQQVLIALWRRLSSEAAIEHPTSYIYRAAVRETVRAVRRELAEQTIPLDDQEVQGLRSAESPSGAVRHAEVRTRVEAVLRSLPAERAEAARGHLRGLSAADLMSLHGWPYQKARNLIARGMADLRERLRELAG
jgi:RNA polymerase sigma factor (sigma-70 family)